MKRKVKMSSLLTIIAAVLMFFGAQTVSAQDSLQVKKMNQHRYKKMVNSQGQHGRGFVDENGDGINDNAPDADGDGIPNGQDPDYTGAKQGNGRGFVDENGDGINDNAQDFDGDGIPNGQDPDFVRPQDGSGQKRGQLNSKRGSGSGQGNSQGSGKRMKKGGGRPQQ